MRLQDLFSAGSGTGKASVGVIDKLALLVLLCFVLAGLIYSAWLPPVARFTDEADYLKLSSNLLHGPGFSLDGVHLTASRPPGYAFFLSAIRAVGGDYFCFRAAQFLLLGGTIFLVSRLGSGRPTSIGLLIVTGLVACYPIVFYVGGTLYPQTLSAFLFVLALYFTIDSSGGLVARLGAGIAFGLLILVVPTFLLTLAVTLIIASILKILRRRDAMLIALVAALIVGGWTVRNAIVFHRFVPVASNSGANLLMGNNALASPYEAAANIGIQPYYQQAEKLGLDEFQSDDFYRRAAFAWIEEHPARAFILYLEKALNFFNIINVYAPGSYAEISGWKQDLMAISYLFLMGLVLWRLCEVKRYPLVPREKLFLAVYILSAFTSAIFFTRIRHRIPFDYLIVAVIAAHLCRRLEIGMATIRATTLNGMTKK